jgi:pimeloyl-ACP methyl ester carboxylesterase
MPKLLTQGGYKIYYQALNKSEIGSKPTLVFLHGWVLDWTCFKKEIQFFKRKGYPIVYMDLRGHGKSDKPDKLEDYHLDLMMNDVYQILKKVGVKKSILIGYSMGGMIACLLSLKFPKLVKKLVLIDSSYESILSSSKIPFFHRHRKIAKLLATFIVNHTKVKKHFGPVKDFDFSNLGKKPDWDIAIDSILHASLHAWVATFEAMFDYDLRGKLSNIKAPTLVIGSTNDQLFSAKLERLFAKKINGSKSIIDKGTHTLIIKEPIEVEHQIYDFILS